MIKWHITHSLPFPGEVFTGINTNRAAEAECGPLGQLKEPCCLVSWAELFDRCFRLGQERGIVPPTPTLLHIHTPRAESNKRGLRGIGCLTREKRLIVPRHTQTMLQPWECGNSCNTVCSSLFENAAIADEGGYIRVNAWGGSSSASGRSFSTSYPMCQIWRTSHWLIKDAAKRFGSY